MISPIRPRTLAAGLLAALALARPAAADPLVTTSETDSGEPKEYVVIVEPADGAVLPGNPDAVVQVVIEYEIYLADPPTLRLDGATELGYCGNQPSPCTLEATVPPGVHTLTATIGLDEHTIAVEVQPANDTTGGETTDATTGDSSSGEPTSGSSGGSGSSETGVTGSTGADTTGGTTDGGTSGSTSGSSDDPGGDKGCACAAGSRAPDLFTLALAALLVPWRRRRR